MLRLLAVLLPVVLFLAQHAWSTDQRRHMAGAAAPGCTPLAFHSADAIGDSGGAVTSLTNPIDTTGCTDCAIFVEMSYDTNTGSVSNFACTYNGVALDDVTDNTAINRVNMSLRFEALSAGQVGNFSVNCTWTGAVAARMTTTAYTCVNPATIIAQPLVVNTEGFNCTSIQATVNGTDANNLVMGIFTTWRGCAQVSSQAGQTDRSIADQLGGQQGCSIQSEKAAGGNVTVGSDLDITRDCIQYAIELARSP